MKKEELKRLLNVKVIYLIICFIVIVLFICLRNTHAFYNYESAWTPIFNSRVGNFTGKGDTSPLTDKNTDINLLFMVQDITNPKNYTIMEGPPVLVSGYALNNEKSNCIPKDATYSNYSIDNGSGKAIVNIKQTKPNQVVCRIYYDYEQLDGKDIIVFALKEDALGMVIYEGKHYTMSEEVPTSGFTYKSSSCKNTNITTNLKYENNKFTFETKGPNICYAYFNKIS